MRRMPLSLDAQGGRPQSAPLEKRRIKAAIILGILLAGALGGSFVFIYATSPSSNWTSTIIDSSGGGVSAASGPAGELFIGYSSVGVKVAGLTDGAWRTVYADSDAQRAGSTAISVDSSGYFHMAFTYDPANHLAPPSLRSVTNRGGTLSIYAFGPESILPAIAVDSNRTAHIAFLYGLYDANETGIGYTTDALGEESAIRIARTEPWSRNAIQIAVGPSDEVYIGAALDVSEGGVGYFMRETNGWRFHQLENVSVPAQGLAMAVEDSGALHLAYAIPGNPDSPAVRYATNRTGTWSIVEIRGIGSSTAMGASSYLSMALDRAGHVHLLGIGPRSSNQYDSTVVYATDAGGTWATFPVTTVRLAEFAGAPLSLAVTSDGHVHVLYTAEREGGPSLIDQVNVPGTVALADLFPRWGTIMAWIVVAGGVGLFAVWLAARVASYHVFRSRRRTWADAKYKELKALRRQPP
jgi:hypothetical protein